MLSLGVGALQLMLDRGGEVDWFSSVEIWIELGLTLTGFWVFIVHTVTAEHPFIDPKIFVDRNFVTGLVFIFVIGIILLATLALLPPMLSRIFDYPTITTGLVMAPRGVGTMISMIVVGRLMQKVDARMLVVIGLLLTAYSLYNMTGFTPQMDDYLIIETGVIQGLGLGLVFVPLSTVAFATLDARFRTDAASLVQPGAQSRLVDRHLDRHGAADAQHRRSTTPNCRPASTRSTPICGRCRRPRRRRPDGAVADRRPGQHPGADDFLCRRLQADDDHHAAAPCRWSSCCASRTMRRPEPKRRRLKGWRLLSSPFSAAGQPTMRRFDSSSAISLNTCIRLAPVAFQ